MDIGIDNEYGKFKFRVSAIIIKDGKLLVEDCIEKCGLYGYPGGHVELGESTMSAIKREIAEELQVNFEVENIYCVIENIFLQNDKPYNEINYFYKIKLLDDIQDNYRTKENDKGKIKEHKYTFIDLDKLDSKLLRPGVVTDKIKENSNLKDTLLFNDDRK